MCARSFPSCWKSLELTQLLLLLCDSSSLSLTLFFLPPQGNSTFGALSILWSRSINHIYFNKYSVPGNAHGLSDSALLTLLPWPALALTHSGHAGHGRTGMKDDTQCASSLVYVPLRGTHPPSGWLSQQTGVLDSPPAPPM